MAFLPFDLHDPWSPKAIHLCKNKYLICPRCLKAVYTPSAILAANFSFFPHIALIKSVYHSYVKLQAISVVLEC